MDRVRDLMRRDFIRVSPGEAPDAVYRLMVMARVRALPVMEGEQLAGMVSHRELARAALVEAWGSEGEALGQGSLARFVHSVEPVSLEATLSEAAKRMLGEATPCLAAAEAGEGAPRVVGLLTEGDLLRAAYLRAADRRPARS